MSTPTIALPILVTVVTLLLFHRPCHGRESYTVVAPKVIRPNTAYWAAVSVEGAGGDLQDVECRIYGRSNTGSNVDIRETSRVPPGETQLVRLAVGELGQGEYRFEVTGNTPLQFQEVKDLEYEEKGYSVFIQTDKAIYRPGNVVQFRAVILSPQFKPSVTGGIELKMTDGGGNLVREWTRVFTTKGVFASSVELADRPVLGNWNITVDVNGQTFSKVFQVAEYILPKFQVDIDLPAYTVFRETMTATIRANYALGSPVKGIATVAVYPVYKSGYIQPIFSEPYRQTVDISGKIDLEFNLVKDLNLPEDFDREIAFEVVVEEEKTKRRQNNTNSVVMYKNPYKLELVKTAESFKPGMPYTCFLKVSYQDGRPVADDLFPVSVKSGFGYDTEAYATVEYPIPRDGIIRLAFVPPLHGSQDTEVLGIEAKYRELSRWFSTIQRSNSPSSNYIISRLASDNPRVNSNVKILVTASEPISSFRYVIMGRGGIINAGTIRNPEGTSHEVVLPTTRDMSPRARLLVSYTREDGEIVSDAMDFEVDGALSNELKISMDKSQAFPGTTVDIELRAKPNSFVGILAVDESVRSLQAGHDIERADLIRELKSYDAGREASFYPWVETIKNQQGSLYWHTGSSSSQQVFDESGVFIITNGYLTQGRTATKNIQVRYNGENRPIGRPILAPGASTLRPDQGPGIPYETATRPPLAGPYAFSRLPRPVDDLPKIFLRNDLPQTWLFTNATTDSQGNALLTVPVPEESTNTSWIVSGFAINQLDGMGVDTNHASLELFQPFYVLANLPYSVCLGESLAVEMVVFSYLSKEISAEVTLENPNGSGFLFGSPNPNEVEDPSAAALAPVELHRTKRITIRPSGSTPVSFIITPREIGTLEIKITAKSSFGKDILVEQLRVEAEGETIYRNEAHMVDLTNKGEAELNITLDIPKTAVTGSARAYVAAVPDPVGPAINNLEALFPYPTGCGEQNLASLLPPVVLLDYLNSVGRSTPKIEINGRHYMELGYQNQLDYLHGDGSMSPFGKNDIGGGSVWLTSLAAGAIQGAANYIDVDSGVIDRALYWLSDGQGGDGAFKERGTVTHRMQRNPVSLTAFAVLGFLENKRNLTAQLRNSMNKAIDYLAINWESLNDPYDLSVVTYALHKAVHPARDQSWAVLESLAKTANGNQFKWWERADVPEDWANNPWNKAPNSLDIEATSYALLTLAERGGITDAVPVAAWLFSQQTATGGFASTSDTYIALRALAAYSIGFSVQDRNTDMSIQYEFLQTVRRFKVSSAEPTVMQKRELPDQTREVKLRATGNGLAIVEVGYQYNENVVGAWPSFVVSPQVSKVSDSHHIQVTVCTHFIEKTNVTGSNMAVIEINMPSGFTVNTDALPALRRFKGVMRVDSERRDTKVIIYFNSIVKKEVCPTVEAFRTHRVSNQRPVPVVVYDYYDQSRRARSFYDVVPSTLCDICDGDDCPDDGCASRTSFPNFGSYAFREAYYAAAGSGVGRVSVDLAVATVCGLLLAQVLRL